MKPKSAKAKGRRLQQEVARLIAEAFALSPRDVRSTSMGAPGTDLLLSKAAIDVFPFAVEIKNTEKLNVWAALQQAMENADELWPMVVFSRNRDDIYVTLRLKDLLSYMTELS